MILTLPLPPSLNNAYTNVPGKGRVLTAEAKQYKQDAAKILMAAKISKSDVPRPPYVLHLWFLYPDKQRRDISNSIKFVEDVLAVHFGYDDREHHQLRVHKALDRDDPRCVAVLEHKAWPVPEPPDKAKVWGPAVPAITG